MTLSLKFLRYWNAEFGGEEMKHVTRTAKLADSGGALYVTGLWEHSGLVVKLHHRFIDPQPSICVLYGPAIGSSVAAVTNHSKVFWIDVTGISVDVVNA